MKGALTDHSHPTRMGRGRRPNPRLASINLNYSIEDIARLYGVHKNTVGRWLKNGLPSIDQRRPVLILGRDLVEFLLKKRQKNLRPCQPGEFYCVRCREPKTPVGNLAVYQAITENQANLVGRCPSCGAIINRRVNSAKLPEVCGKLHITIPHYTASTATPNTLVLTLPKQ